MNSSWIFVNNEWAYADSISTTPLTTGYAADGPLDHNLAEWSYNPTLALTDGPPTNGVIYLVRINCRYGGLISNVWLSQQSNATSGTAGANFVGIYDSTGLKIAQTADLTTPWTANSLLTVSVPLVTPVTLTRGSFYWVGILANLSGQGHFRYQAITNNHANVGLNGYQSLCSVYGTAQTTLPTNLTIANASQTNALYYWVGLS